jgi:hypothetical protein
MNPAVAETAEKEQVEMRERPGEKILT